jgi:hypothetical protein
LADPQNIADFASLVAGHPVSYELLDDYGTGAVQLATWTDAGFEYRQRPRM